MMAEDFERSIDLVSESLELAEELGLDAARSRNLNTRGVARIITGDTGGLRDLEKAIEIAAAANLHEECSARANLTWMTVLLGDVRRAGPLHDEAARLAEPLGLRTYIKWQQAEHVFHCHWEGRWAEAIATAEAFIREAEAEGGHYMESACRDLGRSDELASALDRSSAQTPWHQAARHIGGGDFASAADVYGGIGSVPDEAYARLRAAEDLVRAGEALLPASA